MSPSRSAEIVRFKTPNFSFPGLFFKKILTPCCKQRWPVTWWQALQYWTRCSREPQGTIRMESHGIKSRKWIPVEWRATKHKNIENIRYWLGQICRCYFDFGLTKKTAEKTAMVPPKFILGDPREVSRVERKGTPITLWQPDILSVSVYYNRDRVGNEPREYFWEFLLGVCCPVLLIPTLFKIKKYISFFFNLFIWNWNDKYVHTLPLFPWKAYLIKNQNRQSVYPLSDQSGEKTLPDGATHTYIACIREYTPPPPGKWGESPFIIHFAQVPKERC